jgi:hypothetical protein
MKTFGNDDENEWTKFTLAMLHSVPTPTFYGGVKNLVIVEWGYFFLFVLQPEREAFSC